jgi:hypothetical protein
MRGERGRGRRKAATAIAAATLLALAGCGSRGGDDVAGTLPRDAPQPPTTTQPPPATTPAPGGTTPPGGADYQPPSPKPRFGRGPAIGALVRMRHADTSYGSVPSGFVPGGIPIGTRSGICVVPPPTEAVQQQIAAAARRQTPRGQVLTLHSDALLLADCGSSGRWALVTWTQVEQGKTTDWIDELRYDGGGRWTGTPPDTYPGCRMPLAAASAWQVDVRRCGAGARRAPSTPRALPRAQPAPPRSTQPQPAPQPRRGEPAPLDAVTI